MGREVPGMEMRMVGARSLGMRARAGGIRMGRARGRLRGARV